jgi:hypothetical protein
VREEASRTIGGRFVFALCGIVDVVLRAGCLTGRGALLPLSASPMQQNKPKLLFGCGFLPGRGACRSCFGRGFRRLCCSISRIPNLSANVSTQVPGVSTD